MTTERPWNVPISGIGLRRPSGPGRVARNLEDIHEMLSSEPNLSEATDVQIPLELTDGTGQSRRSMFFSPDAEEQLNADAREVFSDSRAFNRASEHARMAVLVAAEACQQAGAVFWDANSRVGYAMVPSVMPGLVDLQAAIESSNTRSAKHALSKMVVYNANGGLNNSVAEQFGKPGKPGGTPLACATATGNLVHGARMVFHGEVDFAITGSVERTAIPYMGGAFAAAGALKKDDEYVGRPPLDEKSSGMVPGEGAGASFSGADGGVPLAYVVHGSAWVDGGSWMTAPSAQLETIRDTMGPVRDLISDEEINSENTVVIGHFTGTQGDLDEIEVWRRAIDEGLVPLGARLYLLKAHGHLFGASGEDEKDAGIAMMRYGVVYANHGLVKPRVSEDYLGLRFVRPKAENVNVEHVIFSSVGMAGGAATVHISKKPVIVDPYRRQF